MCTIPCTPVDALNEHRARIKSFPAYLDACAVADLRRSTLQRGQALANER